MKNAILFEDNHLIVINKKAGELSQGDETGDIPLVESIKKYLKVRDNKPGNVFLGLVHRLDRPTSGILIFAKTSKALTRMSEIFKTRQVRKFYWALVQVSPEKEEDTLVHYLKKNPKNNKTTAHIKPVEGGKEAKLAYHLIGRLDNYSLLEVELFTGRSHQIRSQLSAIGSPIKGDLKYGAARSNKDGSISLHARKIIFNHPISKEEIEIVAAVPQDPIWQAAENLNS